MQTERKEQGKGIKAANEVPITRRVYPALKICKPGVSRSTHLPAMLGSGLRIFEEVIPGKSVSVDIPPRRTRHTQCLGEPHHPLRCR